MLPKVKIVVFISAFTRESKTGDGRVLWFLLLYTCKMISTVKEQLRDEKSIFILQLNILWVELSHGTDPEVQPCSVLTQVNWNEDVWLQ